MADNKQPRRAKRDVNQVNWGDIIIYPLIAGLMTIGLFLWNPIAGIIGLLATAYLTYNAYMQEKESKTAVVSAIEDLNTDFDEITKSAVFGMPFPMAVLNHQGNFLWYNSSFKSIFGIEGSLLGRDYKNIFPDVNHEDLLRRKEEYFRTGMDDKIFLFYHNVTENSRGEKLVLLYGVDNTEDEEVREAWTNEKMVVWTIYFDNYDEIRAKTPEQDRPLTFAQVDRLVNSYAQNYDAFMVKYESDRYMIIMEEALFRLAEEEKFYLLDDLRDLQLEEKIRPTFSIGIGRGNHNPQDLQKEARNAIDIALSRGGDQVVIKDGEDLRYFGGKTQATERYTKVKARVMSNAVSQFIEEAKDVLIMGHKNPDMDSFGSCLGMLALVRSHEKTAYIVLDEVTLAIENLYHKAINDIPDLSNFILTPAEGNRQLSSASLVVVVDNHRHDSTANPDLLDKGNKVIIVDHHRRGNDYIKDAVISYIEPYASSTSELVTELLSYDDEEFKLPQVIAEGLLAGITVDTKNFFYQTGVRTFEAAALLKRHGADSTVIKELFKDDFSLVRGKSEIISNAEYFNDRFIIGTFDHDIEGSTLVASQATDALLAIRGIEAAFVLARANGRIHISARSIGNISVQLIMEKLGGGGHLTASATQLDMTMDEAKQKLKGAITEFVKEDEDESNSN